MASPVTFERKRIGLFVGLGLIVWFCTVLGLGMAGVLSVLPGLAISAGIWALVLMVLACVWHIKPVYDWVMSLNLRAFVLPHAARLVGVAVIVLYWKGQLPHDLALHGGVADLVVALGALALGISALPIREEWHLRAATVWNIVGLADILGLMFFAAQFYMTDPRATLNMSVFPIVLIPLFVVPLVIASHILLFDRLRQISTVAAR